MQSPLGLPASMTLPPHVPLLYSTAGVCAPCAAFANARGKMAVSRPLATGRLAALRKQVASPPCHRNAFLQDSNANAGVASSGFQAR